MNLQFDKRIGKNLRRIRLDRGLTQDQLAAQLQLRGCDLTRSALAKLEVGQRYFYADEIDMLLAVLQCSYEELFRSGTP